MNILHVDDSKAMRMIVQRTIKQAGFEGLTFIEASNGLEALEVIESEKPDLVLSDWNMPEMNGIDLLKKLREKGNQITLGFITSERTAETKQQAMEAGAAFVITKPFTPQSFRVSLEPVLS